MITPGELRPTAGYSNFCKKFFVVGCLITKFTKILRHDNLELYSIVYVVCVGGVTYARDHVGVFVGVITAWRWQGTGRPEADQELLRD